MSDDIELLDSYNNTEHSLIYEDILDAFNDNLTKRPDNNLVVMDEVSYSYGEGAFIADKIAKSLKDLDVKFGDKIGFLVERSPYYMFSVLGILSGGAVYVPLDDDLPDERLKFILDDTQSRVLIVSDETYNRAKNLISDDVVLLNISDIVNNDIGTLDSLDVCRGGVAGILYTSGSTGVPKGVKITKSAILNVAAYYADTYGLCSDDVYALYPSIGFDAGCESLFKVIYTGACLSIVPKDIKFDMHKLNEYFINQNVTHTIITTQVGKLFMQSADETSLKYLFVGGEKLGEFSSPKTYQLVDEYGPTEGNNFISSINNADKIDYTSIGKLNYNSKAYILDDECRRVPYGALGELYISGYQISDGYLNRPEETNNAFLKNPFSNDDDYSVMYRTGDMVRFLPDGSLGIAGRRDGQVKIRGNRVELSEVESVIREIAYVSDVTVQTIKNGSNNELVAYVVVSEEIDNLKEDICSYISDNKPDYMAPSFVISVDNIPLNVNGKVDKRALPNVNLNNLRSDYVAPTTETEKVIVEAFEKVFNQENIGIYDDFVRLGGDSLTAIKIKSVLDIDVDIRAIFKGKTPYNIAQSIDGNNKEYGFELAKKGITSQNMFLLPPMGGISFVYSTLINSIDFEGNIYIIDDFRYDYSLEEIKNMPVDNTLTFNHYYDAIKDIFQDGDIIVGYSLGCIYASLITEQLEKDKTVGKCILIDNDLKFVNDEAIPREYMEDLFSNIDEEEYEGKMGDAGDFAGKFTEICIINSIRNFHTPKINTHITFLATSDKFKDNLDKISNNYEFIVIDAEHDDIVDENIDKIKKYLK